jgi:sulfatase modifying factor 1
MFALFTNLAFAAGTVLIPAGSHRVFYPLSPEETEVWVPAFRLDVTPVTNAEFLAFVTRAPSWTRGQAPALFVDPQYLSHWGSPTSLGGALPNGPVVNVSWHAARAYCRAQGGELPTTDQWERAADATLTAPTGARSDPQMTARVLDWYGRSGDAAPGTVGQHAANHFGVHDLLGLVWEWTLDFDSQLLSADVREAGDEDRSRFCGSGASSATDVADYASFMRFAYRSSLKASYTTSNLGFRCAYSP